jgi:hypothetical protein
MYYVNELTGKKTWDVPAAGQTVIRLPSRLSQVMETQKNAQERVYDFFVNSTNAYYGMFIVCCAGLAYRIAFPPLPPAPTIGPVPQDK